MKKSVILLIIGVLSLTTTACSKNSESNAKTNSNNDIENATDYTDFDESDKLDAIIYNGDRYCGLGMKWDLEELPDDFELIGQFAGALTDDNEELSSTMIFHDNDNIYHYIDDEGNHYFCVACTDEGTYIGIYQATVSWSYEIDEPHEITY